MRSEKPKSKQEKFRGNARGNLQNSRNRRACVTSERGKRCEFVRTQRQERERESQGAECHGVECHGVECHVAASWLPSSHRESAVRDRNEGGGRVHGHGVEACREACAQRQRACIERADGGAEKRQSVGARQNSRRERERGTRGGGGGGGRVRRHTERRVDESRACMTSAA